MVRPTCCELNQDAGDTSSFRHTSVGSGGQWGCGRADYSAGPSGLNKSVQHQRRRRRHPCTDLDTSCISSSHGKACVVAAQTHSQAGHCHLIFLSPVHHHHYHRHFHYASLHLCSTPDSKLTFSINPSHCSLYSLPHIFGRIGISGIFMTIFGLNCSSFFLFHFFLFDSCYRLS